MTTPDLEGLAREPIKTLADVLCWIDNMAHATAYYEGKANDDAIEAGDVLRALIRSAPAPGREEIEALATRLNDELEEMAWRGTAPMELWDRFSNRVLCAAAILRGQSPGPWMPKQSGGAPDAP